DSPLDAPTTPHTAPLSLHDALPISNGQNTGPTHPYPPLPCCHHPPAPPPCQPARAAPAAICARAAGLPSTRPLRKAPPRESEFSAWWMPRTFRTEADRENADLPPVWRAPPKW